MVSTMTFIRLSPIAIMEKLWALKQTAIVDALPAEINKNYEIRIFSASRTDGRIERQKLQ